MKLSSTIVALAGGHLWLTLVFTMLASMILGMGLATTATYIVLAAITAPAMVAVGVPLLAAHLFVFYYGILADDTPPRSTCRPLPRKEKACSLIGSMLLGEVL